jgi:hypothetical protein
MQPYPDKNTPWRSLEEQLNAMQERDQQGRRRYDTDEGFRAAVVAKIALGYENGPAPVRVEHHTKGTITLDGRRQNRIVSFSHQQMMDHADITRLNQEIAELEAEAAKQQKVEMASALLNISIDPTQAVTPFAAKKDVVAAMGTPQYRNREEVRQFVHARLAASPGILTSYESQANAPEDSV